MSELHELTNYYAVVNEAIELVVETDSTTNRSYLEPRYKQVLREVGLHLENDEELYEVLRLEVEKRNAQADCGYPVMAWVQKMLKTAEAEMTDEENEILKRIMDVTKNQETT